MIIQGSNLTVLHIDTKSSLHSLTYGEFPRNATTIVKKIKKDSYTLFSMAFDQEFFTISENASTDGNTACGTWVSTKYSYVVLLL